MVITGFVTRHDFLEPRDEEENGLYVVVLEGLPLYCGESVLLDDEGELRLPSGQIRAYVTVRWKRSDSGMSKLQFWLQGWERVKVV